MAKMFSDKAIAVLSYLQANQGANLMASDIAAATGVEPKSVNGVITGLAKRGFVQRVENPEFEKKLVVLTDEGKTVDPNMEKEEPAE